MQHPSRLYFLFSFRRKASFSSQTVCDFFIFIAPASPPNPDVFLISPSSDPRSENFLFHKSHWMCHGVDFLHIQWKPNETCMFSWNSASSSCTCSLELETLVRSFQDEIQPYETGYLLDFLGIHLSSWVGLTYCLCWFGLNQGCAQFWSVWIKSDEAPNILALFVGPQSNSSNI